MHAPSVLHPSISACLKARIKEVTKQMMATVSELSMYQATAIKLGAETETAHRVLEQVGFHHPFRSCFAHGI
jgi:hypothetical protein